jgi:hypothetical protein
VLILVAGTDREKEEAEKAISVYKAQNAYSINVNSARAAAAARESTQRLAAEAQARETTARTLAEAEETRKRAVERLRRQLVDALSGERRLSDGERAALRTKLLEAQARLVDEAAGGPQAGVPPALASAPGGMYYGAGDAAHGGPHVPCPSTLPPRFVAAGHAAPTPYNLLSAEELAQRQRAGGFAVEQARRWESEAMEDMLACLTPAMRL